MDKIDILGTKIDSLRFMQALALFEEVIDKKKKAMVVTPNPEIVIKAYRDKSYQKILNSAFLSLPDGVGLLWAAKYKKTSFATRIPGVDFCKAALALAESREWKIFLLGGKPGVAEDAKEKLLNKHPDLKIVGAIFGKWKGRGSDEEILKELNRTKPEIVLVAFGAPKQEKWIAKHFSNLPRAVYVGVGGTLDFFANDIKRAPSWMQKRGLEWVYRIWQQPKRLLRLPTLALFVVLCIVKRT